MPNSLFIRVNAIFLGCNQIEKGFSTAIEFVYFPALGWLMGSYFPLFIEDGKQKSTVMKSAIFDSVIQFRYLN